MESSIFIMSRTEILNGENVVMLFLKVSKKIHVQSLVIQVNDMRSQTNVMFFRSRPSRSER